MIDYDTRKWSSHLFTLAGSAASSVFLRVVLFAGWSVVVVIFHRFFYSTEVPSTVHTLLGVALGLLLVFRTNASYDRFWEGRRLWGDIVNDARNLGRSVTTYLAQASSRADRLVLWTIAFVYASMHSLRGKSNLGPAGDRLPPSDVSQVLGSKHVPLAAGATISRHLIEALHAGELSDYRMVEIDRYVQRLVDSIGGCERIQRTPLPFAYVVHLRRALILYCLTLPFALVGQFGWFTVPYTLLFTYVLCGIDEIGVEIENPFGTDPNDLPLERICESLNRELTGLIDARRSVLDRSAPVAS